MLSCILRILLFVTIVSCSNVMVYYDTPYVSNSTGYMGNFQITSPVMFNASLFDNGRLYDTCWNTVECFLQGEQIETLLFNDHNYTLIVNNEQSYDHPLQYFTIDVQISSSANTDARCDLYLLWSLVYIPLIASLITIVGGCIWHFVLLVSMYYSISELQEKLSSPTDDRMSDDELKKSLDSIGFFSTLTLCMLPQVCIIVIVAYGVGIAVGAVIMALMSLFMAPVCV